MASDCFLALKKLRDTGKIDKKMTDKDLVSIVDEVKKLKDLSKGDKVKYDQFTLDMLKRENLRLVAEQQRILRNAEALDKVRSFSDPQIKNKVEGLEATLVGSLKLVKGGFQSVDGKRVTIREVAYSMLGRGLEKIGMIKSSVEGVLDNEIWKQMFAFGEGKSGRIEGVSDNAFKVALLYNKINKYLLETKKRAGIQIGEIAGYVMRQIHDSEKLNAATFDGWFPKIINSLDHEKSFKGMSEVEIRKSMEEAFKDIVAGRPELATELKPTSSPNQPRAWHFKDAESAYLYNQEFGRGSIYDGITASIRQSARTAALADKFGPDFQKNFVTLLQEARESVSEEIKNLNTQGIKGKIKAAWLSYESRHLDTLFKELRGETEIIGRGIISSGSRGMRAWTAMAKLGNTVYRSLGDVANNAGLLHAITGQGILKSYSQFIGNLFESIPKDERIKFSKMYRVFAEEMLLHQYSHLNVESGIPGRISRMEGKFYQYSGIAYQSQRYKMAMVKSIAANLADNADLSFKDLNGRVFSNLEKFGIIEAHWEVLRKSTMDAESPTGETRGYKVITPEALEYLDDSEFRSVMDKYGIKGSISNFRDDISEKIQQYYSTFARYGTPEANTRTRATLLQGTSGQNVGGVMMRNFAQFKNYSVSLLQTIELMARGNPNGKLDVATPASTAAASILLYYIGDSLYEMSSGRKPKDLTNKSNLKELLQRSGAAGMIGDFTYGEWNKYDGGLGFFTGPAIAGGAKQFTAVQSLFVSAFDDESGSTKKATSDLMNTTLSNTPGYNMAFVKSSLNYALFDHINEALNPGYKQRLKKRVDSVDRVFDNK